MEKAQDGPALNIVLRGGPEASDGMQLSGNPSYALAIRTGDQGEISKYRPTGEADEKYPKLARFEFVGTEPYPGVPFRSA